MIFTLTSAESISILDGGLAPLHETPRCTCLWQEAVILVISLSPERTWGPDLGEGKGLRLVGYVMPHTQPPNKSDAVINVYISEHDSDIKGMF